MVQELELVPGITLDKVLSLILFLYQNKYQRSYSNLILLTIKLVTVALKIIHLWKNSITCMVIFLLFAKIMHCPSPPILYNYDEHKADVTRPKLVLGNYKSLRA